MTQTDTHAPDELRLAPVNHGPTISIHATPDPWRDDDRYRFRLRLTEDARSREAMRELVAARARGTTFLVSFGGRPLGLCVVELLTAHVSPVECTCGLVLHRKNLPAASPEKDPSDGRAAFRPEELLARLDRLFAEVPLDPAEVEEAARETGVDLGRLARRLRACVEEAHLRKYDAAAPDGRADERRLAMDPRLPRAIAHFAELSRRLLADRAEELSRRARGTPSRIHRNAIGSTDPGHGATT